MAAFAHELKQWRAREGYTQTEAALYLGVNPHTFQEWEQERQAPDQMGPIRKVIELKGKLRR